MPRVWDKFLSEQDKAHLKIVGEGRKIGWGTRPAFLLIDNYRGVVGYEREDLLKAAKTNKSAVGLAGWRALEAQQKLLAVGRELDLPIIHITGMAEGNMPGWGYCVSHPEQRGVLRGPVPMRAAEVLRMQAEGAIVLDTRPVMQFAVAHVPGSIHIGLSGQYASWAARILGLDKQIILVGEDADHLRESQMRLARVGIENVRAYLEDGIAGWIAEGYELDSIPQISVQQFAELLQQEKDQIAVLDVREMGEVAAGAIEDSVRIPLGQLRDRTAELDRDKLLVVHCKGGYRSSIATSILRRAGFRNLANLTGGFDAWKTLAQAA